MQLWGIVKWANQKNVVYRFVGDLPGAYAVGCVAGLLSYTT